MIQSVSIENFGPIKKLDWNSIGKINLLIGANATGKTFLLKVLYTLIRSSEECGRGNDPRKFDTILADKLYWTFQVEKLSELISRGVQGRLRVAMNADHGSSEYSLGEKTINTITEYSNDFNKREDNSVFIPAKEVLSLLKIIVSSREQMKTFGFDDTYYDLAKALNVPSQKGKNYKSFSDAREMVENIVNGKLEFDADTGLWSFRTERISYSINITSEGIKKIAILYNLLGNRYLTPSSVLFIDEPEAALHPEALSRFLEIVLLLAKEGIQVFLASHSYFTIKKLLLIAMGGNMDIPVLSLLDTISIDNLKNGMPNNSIIAESVKLYKEEVELSIK